MISKEMRAIAVALRDGLNPAVAARCLEALASDVAAMERSVVPAPARGLEGALPDGVTDLAAVRRWRRRLRLVSDGDAA